MRRLRMARARVIVSALLLVALGAAFGVAGTFAGDSPTGLHACVDRKGNLRVVGNASGCDAKKESPVTLATGNDLAALQNTLGGLQSSVATLQGDAAQLRSDLSTETASRQADVTGLQSSVATLQTDLAALSTQVAGLGTSVSGLQSDLATVKANVTELQTTLTQLRADLTTETTNRQSADSALQTALATETAARIAGDLSCQNQAAIKVAAPSFQVAASCGAVLIGTPPAGSTVTFTSVGQDKTFTITNGGSAAAGALSFVGYTGDHADGWGTISNTCTNNALDPGESCAVTVQKSSNSVATGDSVSLVVVGSGLSWTLVYQP